MMRSKRVGSQSKFMSYLKIPIRALARARDLYVQSLMAGGGHVSYGNAMGCPTPSLPRSMSVKSGFRSADAKFIIEPELRRSKSCGGGVSMARRSKTVAFGRIDEEKAFEFGEDDDGI
ncbi:hypothetical protein C2S52_009687 [Perilla frutescens var. hirtella]|nr:hypothetical protein C2S52_009687 [Perilla frutescens var. hirtella]